MRIFVIDHSEADSALAALVLSKSLPEAEVVSLRPEKAEERTSEQVDAIVADPSYPDDPGLIARLRRLFPDTPVVVFAGEMSERRRLSVMQADPEEWIVKDSVGFLRLPQCVRRAAARSLRPRTDASREFESLLERTSRGYFQADTQGRLLKANRTMARFLDAEDPGELVGRPLPPLFYRADDRAALFERIREHGATHCGEWRLGPQDDLDKARCLEVTETVVRRASGEILIEGLVEDVSSRDRQGRELSRSNRDLQDFAYTASHELQAPLRMVERYSAVLADEYAAALDERGREYLQFAREGALRMQSLVEELLEFSRVESRGRERAECEAARSVEAAVANLRTDIEAARAEIRWNGLPQVRADPVQLTLVFQNLISNAIKFRGQQPPRIDVSGQARNGEFLFSVADNGIGIPEDDLPKVFTLFKRLRPDVPGTGIGLALCRRIVERHGGRIWAESRPPAGSTFFFTLPVSQAV